MSYVALYRKFRPRTFDEVKGQDHVVRTLRNQVKTNRLQHAYLFTGTRGTGKTSVAKILARAVNCEHPEDGNPCGECRLCRNILAGTSMNVIEIDAASNNGVDHIRDIIEEVQYRPTDGNYKVYIIDEVHMLSQGAFNALLKTLEEPPDYVIFILATTEVGRIPVTILSRCQRYDFRRISSETIASRMRELTLLEGVEAEDKALRFIARAADGSMRDALSLLDRAIAFYMGETLTYEKVLKALGEADTAVYCTLTEELLRGDAGGALRTLGKMLGEGVEVGQFLADYIWFLRNLLIVQTASPEDAAELIDLSEEHMRDLAEVAAQGEPESTMRFIRVLSDLMSRIRFAANRRVLAETGILLLAKPQTDRESDALYGRVRQLEEQLESILSGMTALPAKAETQVKTKEPPVEDAVPLPDAAPDDLRSVISGWKQLIAQMPDGLLKNRLKEAGRPQFREDTLENRLFVELNSVTNPTADLLLTDKEHIDENRMELEKFIERMFGFHIDVELHAAESRPSGVKNVDIMETMRNNIMMDVEVEPDVPDDDGLFTEGGE
ncbi:MAG: DNA polymerase III subunit gamma/tau [Lachnospiraceae bacterium]|nr:DNA polymerase III subunit gamma/tau [Lachnospiraceae bacterium]